MTNGYEQQSGFIPTGLIRSGSSWPELAEKDERHELFSGLEDRFGIPERLFNDHLLFTRKKAWWLLRNSSFFTKAAHIKPSLVGLKAFQRVGRFIKPSTRMIQAFGHWASKAILDIDENQLYQLLRGMIIPFGGEIENGYVIISLHGRILGMGLCIDGMVRSQLPQKGLTFLINRDP